MAKERLFLTIDEAIGAIRIAFANYRSQMNLLIVIWPQVFGDSAYLLQDAHTNKLWAKIPGRRKLVSAGEAELKQAILDQLQRSPLDANDLAAVCAHVFGTPVEPGTGSPPVGDPGLWIDTDMTDFVCRRCGHCCRTLNYRDGCSLADYRRWQAEGRTEILAWVGTVKRRGEVVACRIWMEPGTNRYAETCPWLKQVDASGRCVCTIHEVRPMICRTYPGTRQHARLTECQGV